MPWRELSDADKMLLDKIKAFILKDVQSHWTITALSLQFGINEDKLKKQFQQYTGMGIYSYLKQARMEKGKQLIEETNKSVQLIALICGYKSPGPFIRAFKERYGITPLQHRSKC